MDEFLTSRIVHLRMQLKTLYKTIAYLWMCFTYNKNFCALISKKQKKPKKQFGKIFVQVTEKKWNIDGCIYNIRSSINLWMNKK